MIGRALPRPGRDAGTLLARALEAHAAAHGLTLAILDWRLHPWASATFVGDRHAARLCVTGEAISAWLAALPEADLPVRGHIVADLLVEPASDGTVHLRALTLIDA